MLQVEMYDTLDEDTYIIMTPYNLNLAHLKGKH